MFCTAYSLGGYTQLKTTSKHASFESNGGQFNPSSILTTIGFSHQIASRIWHVYICETSNIKCQSSFQIVGSLTNLS